MIRSLVVLGGSGDLTGRYLLPALARLQAAGRLPDGFTVTGVAPDDWNHETFRSHAAHRLKLHAPDIDEDVCRRLCANLHYHRGDVTDPDSLAPVVAQAAGPLVVYLALPHTLFVHTLRGLAEVGIPQGSRLVIEKPFGTGLQTARRLNEFVHSAFPEDSVFRIDHFLAKQTVLNILGLRFANRVFEPVWNALHIEQVDIVWDETLALEGRAGYYDTAGALRDMVQNHLLQLLALLAMEPPTSLDERALRDRKVDLLRAVRTPSRAELTGGSRRARYTAGRTHPAYVDEPGIDPARRTETYAELTLAVDNWRWSGVPFRLRSGKALGRDRREIIVRFRPVPHLPFVDETEPDVLRLTFDPDSISLAINLNGAGEWFDLEREQLTARLTNQQLPPYSVLLLEVLAGDPTLSIRGDEAEECWRIIDPVLAAWANDAVPLEEYPAGSSGPEPRPTRSSRRSK